MAGKLADRKLYIAALGVALAAFAGDRVFLSGTSLGPGVAEAADAAAPAAPASAAGGAKPPAEAGVPLADRLKLLAQEQGLDTHRVRNAFWLEGVTRAPEGLPAADSDLAATRFVQTHTLRAVLSGPRGNLALVGEHRLAVGDELDGFTLVEIEVQPHRRAVFNFDGRNVELTMDPGNLTRTGVDAQGRGLPRR